MKGTDKLSNARALSGSMGVWTGLESTEPSYAQSFTLSTASLIFNAREKKKKKASEASAKHAGWGWGGEQVSRFTLAFSQSRDFLRAFNDRMRMREN